PHNGDAESFAELIRMLDEAAIADASSYEIKDLEHLYIRRTKTDPEVQDSLKGVWADRGPSQPVFAQAGDKEIAVFEALADRWIPRAPDAPSVCGQQLVAYNLFKAFLSSHKALQESIETRIDTLDKPVRGTPGQDPTAAESARRAERKALIDLRALAGRIEDEDSAKLRALVRELKELGV